MKIGMTEAVRVLITLLLVGWLCSPIGDVCAQQSVRIPSPSTSLNDATHWLDLDDNDLLVLELRLERASSGHGLLAYQHGETTLLPLGEITSALELAIMVDATSGLADGWIIDESRSFHLNLGRGTLELRGETIPLPPASVGTDGADLFVRSDQLQKWLPIDIEINYARMNVTLTPREVLPYQARRKREEQRAHWLAVHGKSDLSYPLWVAPYRMFSWPMTDATLVMRSTPLGAQRRFSSQSWGDIGGLSSNLFLTHVSTDDDSRTTARLKAGRWDSSGGLLGRVGATRYEMGDLDISRIPLISTTKRGLGFTISNQNLHRSRDFDTTVVQGDAPAGWEAELYINGILYDFQTVGEENLYFFEDVPMVVGNNTFRTVLYGPRGEKRTIMDHANISPEMNDVGELKYTATMIHEGATLLTDSPGVLSNADTPWSQQLELTYALSDRSALVADLSSLSFDGNRNLYSSLSSLNSLGQVHTEGIVAFSTDGGKAGSVGTRARYYGQNLFFQTTANDAYRAESPDGVQYISRQTIFRSSGSLVNTASRGLFYGLSTLNRRFLGSSLQSEHEHRLRLSGNIGKMLLSHTLRSQRRTYEDREDSSLLGTFLTRTWAGPVSIRGDLTYQLDGMRIRSASSTATFYQNQQLQATLRLNHYILEEFGNDGVSMQVTRLFDRLTLGANLNWYENVGTTFGITLGTFLARDHRSNTWSSTHRRLASRTAASVRTFIDLDNDGVYDGDDVPLGGVGFKNLTVWRDIQTNSNGIALLPGVMAHRPQTIELDLTTVDDPYLIPISKGANVLGHPGGIVDVELAFAYSSEIEGRIVDSSNPELSLRHVGLELLNTEGERVNSTVAEFDGFYYMTDILAGTYALRVIPTTINTRVYEVPEPITIVVPGEGGYIAGPDVVLTRKKSVKESQEMAAVDVPNFSLVALPVMIPAGTDLPSEPEQAREQSVVPVESTPLMAAPQVPVQVSPEVLQATRSVEKAIKTVKIPIRLPRDRSCTGK